MTVPLPELPSVDLISERLLDIFPEGTEHRNYLIRDTAAKTIFTMLYTGAIEGEDKWLRPSQVTGMSDAQSLITDYESRVAWTKISLSNKKWRPTDAWYESDSRESIRDESLRLGLIPCRAVIVRQDLPTTSSRPIYALSHEFSQLFDPQLIGESLSNAIEIWRATHLSKTALARQQLLQQVKTNNSDTISVKFPDGELRMLAPGLSSVIAKAVIEIFAPRFLKKPAVLWLSESGNKVVARDEKLANGLGLKIDPAKALPDIILVDLGDDNNGTDMLIVFTEVVATDGPISRSRKVALTELAVEAGFDKKHLAFLTAYMDRSKPVFKKNIPDLAWGSYAWFVSEPDHIIDLHDDSPRKLTVRN